MKARKLLRKLLINRKYLLNEVKYRCTRRKRARLSYPPRSLTVGISSACYFRCLFCSIHGEDAKHKATYKPRFKMSLDVFRRVVDWAHKGKIRHVHICAVGEPFLHSDILEMLDCVIKKYKKASIQTDFGSKVFDDGYFLNEILKRKEYITYITTDILSWDRQVHESVKVGSDFHKLIEYLRYLSEGGDILIAAHHILTHKNYLDLYKLPQLLKENGINFRLDVVNLHPHNFNAWTSIDNVYTSKDVEIKRELDRFVMYCRENNIAYSVPVPFDKGKGCPVFWSRIQVMPIKTLPRDRWLGNAIPGYCNAVVNGGLDSIGNIFDYEDALSFWNNPRLVTIRQNLLNGIYPTAACIHCQHYAGRQ